MKLFAQKLKRHLFFFNYFSVHIYYEDSMIDIKSFEWFLASERKNERWSKYENMLNNFS